MSALPVFDCDRTCPLFERRDLCRFSPMFHRMGARQVVNSHTVNVKVEYRDLDALESAVGAMGGTVLGHGTHRLYQGSETGFGFRLPDWRYPLVLRDDGSLAYDDYGGAWGNVSDLDGLRGRYAMEAARQAATQLGWIAEDCAEGLRVYHPSGGHLVVSADNVEAFGFHGQGCHDASMALASAMGKETRATAKAEYYENYQQIEVSEG